MEPAKELEMTRVLVCGGRSFTNAEMLWDTLDELEDISTIITGGARGADSLAVDYANERGIPTEVYPAQWIKYGKKAGYLRNKEMLRVGKPDVVIAFPGGRGTEMMIGLAEKAGVEVINVGNDPW